MDLYSILPPVFLKFWWLSIIVLAILILKSPVGKGWIGELIVKIAAKLLLDKNKYHPFHNVILSTPDGTTQIDHIFVSKYGIFVIETKNMKGWIFGDPAQSTWTQQIFKTKNKFQNPLRQNYKHTKAIESLLGIGADAIMSVIVFVGDCTFKTTMPENVTRGLGFISFIKSKEIIKLDVSQMKSVVAAIESGKLQSTFATRSEHVARLRSRSNEDSKQLCPKCGSLMVLRASSKATIPSEKFWGCSQYPKCRTIRKINY